MKAFISILLVAAVSGQMSMMPGSGRMGLDRNIFDYLSSRHIQSQITPNEMYSNAMRPARNTFDYQNQNQIPNEIQMYGPRPQNMESRDMPFNAPMDQRIRMESEFMPQGEFNHHIKQQQQQHQPQEQQSYNTYAHGFVHGGNHNNIKEDQSMRMNLDMNMGDLLTLRQLYTVPIFQEYLSLPLFRQYLNTPAFEQFLLSPYFQQYFTHPVFLRFFAERPLFYKYIYPIVMQFGRQTEMSMEMSMPIQMQTQRVPYGMENGPFFNKMYPQMGQQMNQQMGPQMTHQQMGPQMTQQMGPQMTQQMGPQMAQQMEPQMNQQMGHQQMGPQMGPQMGHQQMRPHMAHQMEPQMGPQMTPQMLTRLQMKMLRRLERMTMAQYNNIMNYHNMEMPTPMMNMPGQGQFQGQFQGQENQQFYPTNMMPQQPQMYNNNNGMNMIYNSRPLVLPQVPNFRFGQTNTRATIIPPTKMAGNRFTTEKVLSVAETVEMKMMDNKMMEPMTTVEPMVKPAPVPFPVPVPVETDIVMEVQAPKEAMTVPIPEGDLINIINTETMDETKAKETTEKEIVPMILPINRFARNNNNNNSPLHRIPLEKQTLNGNNNNDYNEYIMV